MEIELGELSAISAAQHIMPLGIAKEYRGEAPERVANASGVPLFSTQWC